MIKRTALIETLELIEPALANNDLIPMLTHFHFSGKRVTAYNDQIGMSAPLATEFIGMLPGNLLLDMLKASRAENVNMALGSNGETVITAARANIKLAALPADKFIFSMPPAPKDGEQIKSDGNFFEAVKVCMNSVSDYAVRPEQLGITLEKSAKNGLNLYATDRKTLSHARITTASLGQYDGERCILSGEFCKQMIRLTKGNENRKLAIRKDHALFTAGNTVLFTKLIRSEQPLDFASVISHHISKQTLTHMIDMPKGFKYVLERAKLITDIRGREVPTEVTVEKGTMRLFSKTERGEVNDKVEAAKHPDVESSINAVLVSNGCGLFDRMVVTKDSVVMRRGDMFYLVATSA